MAIDLEVGDSLRPGMVEHMTISGFGEPGSGVVGVPEDGRGGHLRSGQGRFGRDGPCRVFVSYAHVDEAERIRLTVHLAPLVREGLINPRCNRVILPGADWKREINNELAQADIVILLVTADFIASVYCFEKEMVEALRGRAEDGVRVLPVIVKPADFRNMPFGRFQALPRNLRPISTWANADEAWLEVVHGVREVVRDIYRSRAAVPVQRTGSSSSSPGMSRCSSSPGDSSSSSSCCVRPAWLDRTAEAVHAARGTATSGRPIWVD
ncbi:MAG: TIR domain-containing protein [Actinophytocola sp.]|uniref:toll/interleukin-1 receptor domain-containing protein n=1 Tax=Actinophytocola sp. TaxID=1872138 RepID=UPI00132B9EA1|nr:toll/interleukin-1 receptor domain-containing protein [Actinophytocola sp.]MPZ82340.1 TIR domain-containing protein [Actinophytocola sp.]